jgi:glycerol-1-phosphate dehydrogenase [NAD(P)+]
MVNDIPIYIGRDVTSLLIDYCSKNNLNHLTLVADKNTYAALGGTVKDRLLAQGFDLKTILLTGHEIVANEHYLVQVLVDAGAEDRTYLAVGSGTITDITRFVSHRTKTSFISLPTAPSVDGFTSIGAPLVIGGLKKTVISHPPRAVFADLDVLGAAPQEMIASGFGDMLGKYTSLADWKLGHLLWGEPYDEHIYNRAQAALKPCVDHTAEIGQALEVGINALINGLIESGFCMLEFGESRPASGAEHQISHHLEMKLLWENRPAILHGAKVGAATIIVAGFYEKIRKIDRQTLLTHLKATTFPAKEQEIARISAVYEPIAGRVIANDQALFLQLAEEGYDQLIQRIIDCWGDIQAIAATVPAPQALFGWLQQAGGVTDLKTLGFSAQEISEAVEYSHYLRNRFNVNKLRHIIGMDTW